MEWEKRALDVLRRFSDYPCHEKVVFFSGGKDSTCTLHLALRSWDRFTAVYVDTTIAFPEVEPFVRDVCSEWGIPLVVLRPERCFFEQVATRRLPLINRLWCRDWLKIKPMKKYVGGRIVLGAVGVRRSESTWRSKNYKRHFAVGETGPQIYPILEWSRAQRDAYIKKYNIPVNPCYEKYGVSGCYYCPYYDQKIYLRIKSANPELFMKLVELEKLLGTPILKGRLSAQKLLSQRNLNTLIV